MTPLEYVVLLLLRGSRTHNRMREALRYFYHAPRGDGPRLVLGLAAIVPCWGSPFFKIEYTGVVTAGTLNGLNSAQTGFNLSIPAGAVVSGTLIFDLGLAPAPRHRVRWRWHADDHPGQRSGL